MTASFDVEHARNYWRFVPSGEGKHDTAELLKLSDRELEQSWDRAFTSRFHRYPEEDCFVQTMVRKFAGKRVLSIGSGLGFHELYYHGHGAQVTCVDIVQSNLQIIERIARIKRLGPLPTILADETNKLNSARVFDVGFIYGSLMTMPVDRQRDLLSCVKRNLNEGGCLVLMLYTWEFAATTCGWASRSEFDPRMFARASDPTVGDQYCPWSDWHDDAKILDLAGPDMVITHRQLWQDGLFVWYALSSGNSNSKPAVFFDANLVSQGASQEELPATAFKAASGKIAITADGLQVHTGTDQFGYAVISLRKKPTSNRTTPNALRADLTLLNGALSVGILDTQRQVFVHTTTVTRPGRHTVVLPFSRRPNQYQVVFSNHRTDGPLKSSFCLHRVEFIHRRSVVDSPLSSGMANQLVGGPAWPAENLDEFWSWLRYFPSDISNACRSWIESNSEQTWIATPLSSLTHFRMSPARCLKQILRTLRYAWKHLPPPARVIWGLENHDNRGLDDFEADAIFGTLLDVDLIHQVDRGSSVSRIVVAGRLRQEVMGLAFTIDPRSLECLPAVKESLQILMDSGVPVVTTFIDHDTACDLLQKPNDDLALTLRRLMKESGMSLGLHIPEHRHQQAQDNLNVEASPLVQLSGGLYPVDHIRFERADFLDSPTAAEKLCNAGFRYDSSTMISLSDASVQPYVRGAYQPQVFDHRSPAGIWSEGQWLECPLFSVGTMQLKDVCKSRQIAKPARLARLLDFRRMERFYRGTGIEPSLNQKYSDYRVYNWPAAEPSPRTTLIDCGDLSNLTGVRSTVDKFIRPDQTLGAHARVAGHQEFLSAVAEECKRRAPESVATAMQAQVDAHGYLESIDSSSALREDIREFLGFLPQKLGSTLELGSGTGQLANALLPRCSYFIGTEIKPLKMTALPTVGADVHALPFSNAVFSTVIANNTLEHLYNPLMCLKEVRRVLVPAGHLYALIPLDGLNPKHQIRTHLWKADEINIRRVIELAGLTVRRMELMNLYDLGIHAAFPSCNGWVCKIDAERPGEFE